MIILIKSIYIFGQRLQLLLPFFLNFLQHLLFLSKQELQSVAIILQGLEIIIGVCITLILI